MVYPKQESRTRLQKSALARAVALALGATVAQPVLADIIDMSFTSTGSLFTMLTADGAGVVNTDGAVAPWYGWRTPIDGTMTYDTAAQSGTMKINPFSFFGKGSAIATTITFQAIGNGFGGPGNLILTNMGFNWNNNNGIPVSALMDASGFFAAKGGPTNLRTSDVITGGALAASDTTIFGTGKNTYTLPMGPGPIVSTAWNTTTITPPGGLDSTACTLGCNPSGQLPLIADTVGGTPMVAGPFKGFNASFDFNELTVTRVTDTTPPVVTFAPGNTITINVGDAFNPLSPPGTTITVADAFDGTSVPVASAGCTVTNTVPAGSTPAGNYKVTYDCSDLSGNKNSNNPPPLPTLNVTVITAGAPTITLVPAADPFIWEATVTPYADPGASCLDSDGTTNIPVGSGLSLDTSALNVNTLGLQSVTWNCTGSSTSTAVPRNVDVKDTKAPNISLTPVCNTGSNIITVIADGTTDPTPAATATDALDGNRTVTQGGDVVALSPVFGELLSLTSNVSFNATDKSGNQNNPPIACQIVQGNPKPVASLLGQATAVIDAGAGFTDPGANCAEVVKSGPGLYDPLTTVSLPKAVPSMAIDSSTPNGTYPITYTCTGSRATGTIQRTVIVGAAFSAKSTSGSNFTMPDGQGRFVGGAADIFFSWTGSLYTSKAEADAGGPNMFMGSALPTPFFGFPWKSHDIFAFGPGDYTFTTNEGNTQTLHIGENQMGAHMLFDWNVLPNGKNKNINVVLTWDLNQVYTGTLDNANDLGAKGNVFTLSTVDTVGIADASGNNPPGDGITGTKMVDGPFAGFSPNFNIKMTPPFTLPSVSQAISQGSTTVTNAIAATTPVTLTATVNPDINGVYSYAGPFTFDWSTSDAALLALNPNISISGNSLVGTFVFNPSTLPVGTPVTARAKVRDSATGLTSTIVIPLQVVADAASATDSDADGIPDTQDAIDNTVPANAGMQQVISGSTNGTSFVMQSSAGKLVLGDIAARSTGSGVFQAGVSTSDIGVPDDNVAGSCIGGCFSFDVTGLNPGDPVDVVLPLSEAIPANAGYRKLIGSGWADFYTAGGNAIASTAGTAGNCPAPTDPAWTSGLTAGDLCVKLTIVDGGTNDTDFLANGIVKDPGGVSGPSTVSTAAPGSVGSPNTGGGCALSHTPTTASKHTEWWLLGGLLGWLGFSSRRRDRKHS